MKENEYWHTEVLQDKEIQVSQKVRNLHLGRQDHKGSSTAVRLVTPAAALTSINSVGLKKESAYREIETNSSPLSTGFNI
jgi:hypothetical protein